MNGFDCTQVRRWLDGEDAPSAGDSAAVEAHAAGCPDCTSRLAAERAVVALFAAPALATGPALASPGFADRVLARVALTPQLQAIPRAVAAPAPVVADALPWWIRVAARPEAILASLVAGLALLLLPQLIGFAGTAPRWGAEARDAIGLGVSAVLAPVAGRIGADPLVGAGVALAFLPLVLLLAYALYLFGMQVARVRLVAAVAPGRRP